jgi:hypothetical protein
MASVWQAPDDIRRQVESIKDQHHPHLSAATIWVLCSDSKAVRDNRIVVTTSRRCTKTEKLSSGHDFKITVFTESWSSLPNAARTIALDEALCRCGVRYVPAMVEVNGKKEIIKDEWGRIIYTDEIDYDKEGVPRWKINQPDAGVYFGLLTRHGQYAQEVENISRALAGKPLILPTAAQGGDLIADVA